MLQAVADAASAAHADPELRSFIITGAGERVFCAGADVSGGEDMFEFTRDPVWVAASQNIADLPCLTIAALNGTLAGGGFALALACDIRIATPQAKFFYPVLKTRFLATTRRRASNGGTVWAGTSQAHLDGRAKNQRGRSATHWVG